MKASPFANGVPVIVCLLCAMVVSQASADLVEARAEGESEAEWVVAARGILDEVDARCVKIDRLWGELAKMGFEREKLENLEWELISRAVSGKEGAIDIASDIADSNFVNAVAFMRVWRVTSHSSPLKAIPFHALGVKAKDVAAAYRKWIGDNRGRTEASILEEGIKESIALLKTEYCSAIIGHLYAWVNLRPKPDPLCEIRFLPKGFPPSHAQFIPNIRLELRAREKVAEVVGQWYVDVKGDLRWSAETRKWGSGEARDRWPQGEVLLLLR